MRRPILFMLLCLCSSLCWPNPNEVRVNQTRDRSAYMLGLLKLVLSYSEKKYTFTEEAERLSKSAEREAALNGKISVFWGGTSREQESNYLTIPIDGYRGLMGMRFFIIRSQDQQRFSAIKSLDELRSFKLGQGRGWSDIKVLEASNITVERSVKKKGLYYMLEGGRFDAFPRGATEAWAEAEANKHLNLAVEKSLIVAYPLPHYFFVNKQQTQLAEDIKTGFRKILADGSFDEYFFSNKRVKTFLSKADLANRTVIALKNPFLSDLGIEEREIYTLKVEDLINGAKRNKDNNRS